MDGDKWVPNEKSYVVDTSGGTLRFGRVTRRCEGSVFLRPPGGGAEWAASPERVRRPTDAEWAQIRVVTTPVRVVGP
ncbi:MULTISPECIES: hypothetical protein [Streptomyces]|uniref:hypothetical protein n=1 Tax=Streptomyces TaxID=1883 RepID=UPI000787FD5B|nr:MULTISPECIES: hypothetical protein [unclassified Streptomyces]AVH95884.1 hypothetical protein C5L38_13025 [Streptomyces sp. WAC00288]KYG54547.1 hypothetical protein AWI43_08840 [Streptomyces sp. WAC04657]PVC74643.1 hypothetical protein DBP18_10740 [Streptomyces sp. CS081A]